MVSGNAAAANADALIYNVMFSFYTACASFIGQNWGAGNKKRMLKSYGRQPYPMPSSQARSLVDCFLFSGRSFCHCLPQNRLLLMPVCRESGSWASVCFQLFMDSSIAASRGIGKSIPPTIIVSWVLRIPYYLDLYGIRTLPDHFRSVSSVYFLMGNYRLCGSSVLCFQFQKNPDMNTALLLLISKLSKEKTYETQTSYKRLLHPAAAVLFTAFIITVALIRSHIYPFGENLLVYNDMQYQYTDFFLCFLSPFTEKIP